MVIFMPVAKLFHAEPGSGLRMVI